MTYAERIERVAIAQYDVLRRMLNDKFSDLTWADLSEAQREDHRAVARAAAERLAEYERPRPLAEWHEGDGDVLWWAFPVEEPPYVGSPISDDWPGRHTHWTPILVPKEPEHE